jgi:endoglucanase
MKKYLLGPALALAAALSAAGQPAAAPAAKNSVWHDEPWHRPEPNPKATLLPQISVKGNHFVDPSGATVLFRGLSIADPDKLMEEGRWNRELFVAVKDMGANLVRIPVHPAAWRSRGREAYLKLLDQAVDWCTDLGMHVIIDWHSIGNLRTEMFQDPMYNTTKTETFAFWRTAAMHFHGNHTVAFYELFNEPTHYNGMLGAMTWPEWRDLNEEMIGIIRYWDKQTIPLVAGFDWAYDLTALRYDPIRAEGIGYVTHPYPFKRKQPWEPRWEEDFAFAADTYPMIATEIGFDLKPGEVVDDTHYGNRITRFLEERGISWMAWVFDPSWGPAMLKSFDGFELAGDGEFFKKAMHRPPAEPLAKPSQP